MDKPRVTIKSTGPEGNIYFILGKVRDTLRKERRYTDYNDLRDKVLNSKSYKEAIEHIREIVDLVDTDGKI